MTLTIPDVGPDDDALTAALKYANAGWYVIPIKRGTKHPGSILGRSWQRQSTRDTEQIVAWWAGTDHGIALHCGRSGAVVLDIDNPDKVPDVIRQHGGQPPAQLTRPATPDRRHLVYQVPDGRQLGNGNGQLGGAWGEVRGQNGVIVVAPSYHPEGGEYRWLTTGPVPVLPEPIACMLPNADLVDADAATDAQVAAFFEQHTAASQPGLIGALVNRFRQRVDAGESRHQTGASVLSWAMDEAVAGIYSAREADTALRKLFVATKTEVAEAGGRPLLSQRAAWREWDGIRAWAVGRALAKTTDRRTERVERAATVQRDDAAGFAGLIGNRQPATPPASQPDGDSDDADPHRAQLSAQAAFLSGVAVPAPPVVAPVDEFVVPPLRLVKASSIRSTMPTWAWEYDNAGRILKGGLTLFAGRPAAGKSTTARWFAAGWTNGTLPGCWEGKPVNVAYIATEEAWNHTVVPSLKAAGADMDRVFFVKRGDDPARVKARTDEFDLTEMFRADEVRAVFLDPLMSTIGGSDDTYRSNEVREALDPWVRISEAIDGVALGITHLTKAAKNVTAGINGSSAFGEVARCVFGFAVDKEANDGTRVMSQDKNSSGIGGLNLAYRIGQQTVTFDDGGTGPMARFELVGTTDRNVSDLLSEEQNSGGRTSSKSECVQWLNGYLATKGPTASLEVRAAGADLGFSESAIKRAAQKLNIQQERTREVPSKTLWRLPSDNTESDDQ